MLKEYKANYPDVTLRILEGYSGSLMDSLASGKVDIAVVNNMDSLGGVAVIPLLHDHLVLVSRWQSGKRVPTEIPARKLASSGWCSPRSARACGC